MNERIIELANEANKDIGYTFKMEEAKQLHELMEKFAELIVRECMRKTAGYLLENEFGGSDVKEASEELAKHFGVEE